MAPTSTVGRGLYQAAYVIAGAANVLIYQWQDDMVVDEATGRKFVHPIGQLLIGYLGMIGLWIGRRVYLAKRCSRRSSACESPPDVPPQQAAGDEGVDVAVASLASSTGMPLPSFRWYYAAPPGFLHFVSLFLTVLSVKYTTAAIVQILRGASVIFVAGLTRIVLKRTLALYQYFGIGLVVCGVVVVSAATLQRVRSKSDHPFGSNPLLGDILVVSAQFFLTLRGVLEERVMKQHDVHELEMAGWEGFVAVTSCLFAILVGVVWPAAQLDDLGAFVTDMGASKWALISTLLLTVMMLAQQATALGIVKIASAVTKTVLSQLRIVFVWVPSVLFMGGVVSPLELVGFVILTFGAFVYKDMGPQLPSFCYPAPPVTDDDNSGDLASESRAGEGLDVEMLPGDDGERRGGVARYGATA